MRPSWVMAGLAFALTAFGLHAILPSTPSPVAPKLHYFERYAGDYTTVFLGTSVVYRQIDPRLFDSELRRAGITSRSYNLGAPGMVYGEAAHLVASIFRAHPTRLAFLVLDADLLDLDDGDEARTRRYVAWHEPAIAVGSIVALFNSRHEAPDRMTHMLDDARALVYEQANAGVIATLVSGESDPPFLVGDEGFLPLVHPNGAHRRFLQHLDQYHAAVEHQRTSPGTDGGSQYVNQMLARIVEQCRAHGVTPIAVRSPRVRGTAPPRPGLPLLDFSDSARYPDLFDPANRFDELHLNAIGARLYTRQLAQRFIEWLHAVR